MQQEPSISRSLIWRSFFLVNNARPVQYDNWLTQFSGKKKKGMGNRFSQVKTAMLEVSK